MKAPHCSLLVVESVSAFIKYNQVVRCFENGNSRKGYTLLALNLQFPSSLYVWRTLVINLNYTSSKAYLRHDNGEMARPPPMSWLAQLELLDGGLVRRVLAHNHAVLHNVRSVWGKVLVWAPRHKAPSPTRKTASC